VKRLRVLTAVWFVGRTPGVVRVIEVSVGSAYACTRLQQQQQQQQQRRRRQQQQQQPTIHPNGHVFKSHTGGGRRQGWDHIPKAAFVPSPWCGASMSPLPLAPPPKPGPGAAARGSIFPERQTSVRTASLSARAARRELLAPPEPPPLPP